MVNTTTISYKTKYSILNVTLVFVIDQGVCIWYCAISILRATDYSDEQI